MPLRIGNQRILDELHPFLVATRLSLAHFDLAPFGIRIPRRQVIDPLRMRSAEFLHQLQRLDTLTFGPEGMPMPRWVFFDGAELPGAIFGFGRRPETLSRRARALLQLPRGYRRLVPYSMFIALPMLDRQSWMGHNLASLNPIFTEEKLSGLASVTKSIGLKAFRAAFCYGVTQWRSLALHIHTKFGPLDLLTAFTPAHSDPRSLTYRFEVTDECLRAACGDPAVSLDRPAVTRWVDADDERALRRMHRDISQGRRLRISAAPQRSGEDVRVPVSYA